MKIAGDGVSRDRKIFGARGLCRYSHSAVQGRPGSGADSPAELSRGAAGIGAAFLRSRADHLFVGRGVETIPDPFAECLLHAAVLAGMKGQDGRATAGLQAMRQV